MNTQEFEQRIEQYRSYLACDEPVEAVIARLRADGFMILEAIKMVKQLYSVSLREAKQQVTTHPAWADIVRANEPFHDELEKIAKRWSRRG